MNEKIIIGIDGISYSGKTTLCNIINKTNNKMIIVDESPKFSNTKIQISNNVSSILKNAKVTLEIEKSRGKYVKEFIGKTFFLFDRTIFSFVAISYAYYENEMVDYFNRYLEEIINGIEREEYLVPDYFVFLKIDKNELIKRIAKRKKNLPNYWLSENCNNSINHILEKRYNFYKEKNRCLTSEELMEISSEKLSKIKKEEIIVLLRRMKV